MFLLITRVVTDDIKRKLHSLLNAGIDAYVIVDKDVERKSKRFITYDNKELEEAGFMRLNVSRRAHIDVYKVTGWDKAVYHAYKSGEKHVWICEDDVYWNRPAVIKMILDATENKKDDLICFKLAHSYQDNPSWYHWPKVRTITSDKSKWMGTYNQLSRVSHRLLTKVAKFANERKELLLHEAVLPTLSKINNYTVSYIPDLKLPIHIEVRWSPVFTESEIEEALNENSYVLLHPVKTVEAQTSFIAENKEGNKIYEK